MTKNNTYKRFTTITDGNLAFHVNDNILNVQNNHNKILENLGLDKTDLFYMNQVHGNRVEVITKDSPNLIKNCDGLITNMKNKLLMVMVADCIPILFNDNVKGVIAAVHAGRNSTLQKIVEVTVNKMISEFSSNPCDIEVEMGPSIQKCCYEVDDKLANIVKNSFGEEFVDNRNLDLQGINKKLLNSLGVKNIIISSVCTLCSTKIYYSYRENKNCGRFSGLIYLK